LRVFASFAVNPYLEQREKQKKATASKTHSDLLLSILSGIE